jgi:hypothetical protein
VLASATIAALPINAWPKPEFLEILREKWLYFEKCAKNGLFSEKHHTIFAAEEVFW